MSDRDLAISSGLPECAPAPEPGLFQPWFAVRVKSRCEHLVSVHLRDRGFHQFLPLYRARRVWSDRCKYLELPLFPGYIFCRFDLHYRLPVLTAPGVVGIIGAGRTPIPIEQLEIEQIQRVILSGLAAEPWRFLEPGRKVYIAHGPFAGMEGVVITARGKHRLLCSITLLKRTVAVEIDGAWVNGS